MNSPQVVQRLHPKQGIAIQSSANEILYGGAAGGGKSHLMRVAAIAWCMDIPGLQVYLFRRQSVDLEKNHLEGPTGLRALLQPYVEAHVCQIVQGEIRFKNGSKIYLCHCKDEKDKYGYQGSEMHVLLIDELTHFTEGIYRFLRSRVRLPDSIKIPDKYKGMFPRILTSSNPGNIGHQWVKDFFIDNVVPLEILQTPKEDGGYKRQYIPARLDDNPSLDTVEYEKNLSGVGSPALVKALRDGDWNAVQGAYFPEMGMEHYIDPFAIPVEWIKFRAFDWGSYHPFCCLWMAVSDGTYGEENDFKPCPYPKGAIIVYKEWYGGSGPNKGLALANWEIAAGILERDGADRIDYSVADPSIFKEEGGPSIAEQMAKRSVFFKRGDNTRITGAHEFRGRLIGEGAPLIYFFSTCVNCIRTIPALQHDDTKPELWNTDMDDHAFDAARYGVQSRPWFNNPKKQTPMKTMHDMTMDEVWEKCRPNRIENRYQIWKPLPQ